MAALLRKEKADSSLNLQIDEFGPGLNSKKFYSALEIQFYEAKVFAVDLIQTILRLSKNEDCSGAQLRHKEAFCSKSSKTIRIFLDYLVTAGVLLTGKEQKLAELLEEDLKECLRKDEVVHAKLAKLCKAFVRGCRAEVDENNDVSLPKLRRYDDSWTSPLEFFDRELMNGYEPQIKALSQAIAQVFERPAHGGEEVLVGQLRQIKPKIEKNPRKIRLKMVKFIEGLNKNEPDRSALIRENFSVGAFFTQFMQWNQADSSSSHDNENGSSSCTNSKKKVKEKTCSKNRRLFKTQLRIADDNAEVVMFTTQMFKIEKRILEIDFERGSGAVPEAIEASLATGDLGWGWLENSTPANQ